MLVLGIGLEAKSCGSGLGQEVNAKVLADWPVADLQNSALTSVE